MQRSSRNLPLDARLLTFSSNTWHTLLMLFSQTIASWNRSCCTDTVVATPWGKKNWRIVQEFCKALKKSSDDLKREKGADHFGCKVPDQRQCIPEKEYYNFVLITNYKMLFLEVGIWKSTFRCSETDILDINRTKLDGRSGRESSWFRNMFSLCSSCSLSQSTAFEEEKVSFFWNEKWNPKLCLCKLALERTVKGKLEGEKSRESNRWPWDPSNTLEYGSTRPPSLELLEAALAPAAIDSSFLAMAMMVLGKHQNSWFSIDRIGIRSLRRAHYQKTLSFSLQHKETLKFTW